MSRPQMFSLLSLVGLIFLGLMFLGSPSPVTAADLILLSGKSFQGDVRAITASHVTFHSIATGEIQLATKEILVIDFKNPGITLTAGTTYDEIELTDGSRILVQAFAIKGKTVPVELLPPPGNTKSGTATIPLGTVFSVLRNAQVPDHRTQWKQLIASRGKRDLFVIRQPSGLNPLPGTLLEGNETGDRVTFELETGGQRQLPLSRASGGLIFNQPPRSEIPPTICQVHDTSGNILFAQAIELSDNQLVIRTVSGANIRYPGWTSIRKLDFSQGNLLYLTDAPLNVTAPPAILGEPRLNILKNRYLDGTPLRLNNTVYERGLWVAPGTVITVPIAGEYREFKAILGIDDRVPVAECAVRIVIEADGRVLFAETIARKDPPRPVTLDVQNVQELRISVEPQGLYLGNHLTIAEARVQK